MRLLVVEDEPRLLRSLAKALREEGYAVDTAGNGEDGLFKAENSDYDCMCSTSCFPLSTVGMFSVVCASGNGRRSSCSQRATATRTG